MNKSRCSDLSLCALPSSDWLQGTLAAPLLAAEEATFKCNRFT